MSSNAQIKLVVGLGNPGAQYENTRHNAGVWYLEQLARRLNMTLQNENRFLGLMGRSKIRGEDLFLLFPTTYMNRSGQSVGALAKFFKIQPTEILVAHDELDLAPGQLKLKKGGGHAGHNGLRDIQAHLGTNDYWRARIGIGHPRSLGLNQGVSDFVLHRPTQTQQTDIDRCIDILLSHTQLLLDGQFSQASTRIHTEVDQAYKETVQRTQPATGARDA